MSPNQFRIVTLLFIFVVVLCAIKFGLTKEQIMAALVVTTALAGELGLRVDGPIKKEEIKTEIKPPIV